MTASYIAVKENSIAEKYFGNTLRQSEFLWPQELSQKLKEMAKELVAAQIQVGSVSPGQMAELLSTTPNRSTSRSSQAISSAAF